MKVFEMLDNDGFDYPDEMELILNHLNSRGKINVSNHTIESLYREFSDEFFAAGWMGIVNESDPLLKEFASWLSEQEI